MASTWFLKAVTPTVFGLVLLPATVFAQGVPVETASPIPLAIWVIGLFVLGLAIAYGIWRNGTRTRAEKQTTERATKNLYAAENARERREP